MNNNDDGFKENLEYMAPNEMPTSQILTPTEVIEASDDLRPYIQLMPNWKNVNAIHGS